jgi:hypothetical protein
MMIRTATCVVVALLLAGCAGGPALIGTGPTAAQPQEFTMAGRWMLAAPNAPVCGMNFSVASGARAGKVAPEGGCPENFYLSRTWALEQDALVINDDENNPLGRLKLAGGRFEGQSTAGTPLTLSRQPTLAN